MRHWLGLCQEHREISLPSGGNDPWRNRDGKWIILIYLWSSVTVVFADIQFWFGFGHGLLLLPLYSANANNKPSPR